MIRRVIVPAGLLTPNYLDKPAGRPGAQTLDADADILHVTKMGA
jgi:hypothetical protein